MAIKNSGKLLGNLEEEVMEAMWKLKKAKVRDVLDSFKGTKKPAYTTVMTVMTRLSQKGILKRKMVNDYYIYKPVQNKESFLAQNSKKIINSLFKNFGEDLAIAQFIDHIENIDYKKSKDLRKKLKDII